MPKSLIPTEAQEQIALVEWAKLTRVPFLHKAYVGDYLICIPNGGSRHKLEAKNLKQQGVKKGVSDLFLALPRQGFSGLWLEMKRIQNSKVSREQIQFLRVMNEVGYLALAVYGFDHARKAIADYLELYIYH